MTKYLTLIDQKPFQRGMEGCSFEWIGDSEWIFNIQKNYSWK